MDSSVNPYKRTVSPILPEKPVSPTQVDLECLIDTEKIASEARLLAGLLRISVSAFACTGSAPAPVSASGEMVWDTLESGCSEKAVKGSGEHLKVHWQCAQEAVKKCRPVQLQSASGKQTLVSYPVILRYRGRSYAKACITAAFGAVENMESDNDNTSDVARRVMEIMTTNLSNEITASYRAYRESIERQETENRLREEKERLNSILQSIDVGLCLVDRDLKIMWSNLIIDRWFGPVDGVRGKRCCDLFGLGKKECTCPVDLVFRTSKTHKCLVEQVEAFAASRDYLLTANPVVDAAKQVSQVMLVVQDVTGLKETRIQIERYKKLLDNVDDYVMMADLNGNILAANRKLKEVLGYTEEELQQLNAAQLHPESEFDKAISIAAEAFKNERARGVVHLLTKDGREIPTEVVVTHSKADQTMQGIYRDITERIKMEKELKKRTEQLEAQNMRVISATRQKNQFFASMSHDLRTPMTSIIGFAELLLEDEDEPLTPSQRKLLAKIKTSGDRLLDIINDLLDLSKLEAARMTVNIGEIDVRELIDQTVGSIMPLVRDKDIELISTVEYDLPKLYSDEQKLEQIIVNLLSNAVKFTEVGQIKVQAKRDGQNIAISVSDTGVGIKRSDHKRIFEEFWQANSARSKKKSGTGLGLAIAKKLAYILGGDIKVKSKLGEGSTFTVVIPFNASNSLLTRRSKTVGFIGT